MLALKAFSMFALAPLVRRYLHGTCASGLHEARLGAEEFGGENHVYCAAFSDADFTEVKALAHHIVFNSLHQLHRFEPQLRAAGSPSVGLRVNPLHSEGTHALYDPCAPGSRLGIPITEFDVTPLSSLPVAGLHFHTLCEQGFAPLARTLDVIETRLGEVLHELEWINLGGGHHITQPGYDLDGLIHRLNALRSQYDVQVYIEPGEAIAVNTGVLVSSVLDIVHNEMPIAILDTSATCHMPDTLEMPYRADIFGAAPADVKAHTYRLGGQTCLAGDVMGDYSFDQPLTRGQRLMFDDMSHYTMVKTSTFNGINLPAIAIWNSDLGHTRVVREFGYTDFKTRLS